MDIETFIRAIRKAESHLHIEGTLEPDLKFQLAARNGLELPYGSALPDDSGRGRQVAVAETSGMAPAATMTSSNARWPSGPHSPAPVPGVAV